MTDLIRDLQPRKGGSTKAIVKVVKKGSPAQIAGMKSGDEIVAINGKSVRGDLVPELIWNSRGSVKIAVKRNGKIVNLKSLTPQLKSGERIIGFDMVGVEKATPPSRSSRLRGFLSKEGAVSGVRA